MRNETPGRPMVSGMLIPPLPIVAPPDSNRLTRHFEGPLLQACLAYLRSSTTASATVGDSCSASCARNLLGIVAALPELRPTPEGANDSEPWRRELFEIRELIGPLGDHDGADQLFKARAEEVVARARDLQIRFPDARSECSRVIRSVTHHAKSRFVFVFGLRTSHRTDWKAQAVRAMACREQLERGNRAAQQLHESKPQRAPTPAATKQVGTPAAVARLSVELPLLRAMSASRPVLIVGGAGKTLVSTQVKEATKLSVEWLETRRDGGGTRQVQTLADRVKGKAVAAVVIVEGAIRHDQYLLLVRAARSSGAHVGYAKKGGVLSVLQALRDIEQRIGREDVSDSAKGACLRLEG